MVLLQAVVGRDSELHRVLGAVAGRCCRVLLQAASAGQVWEMWHLLDACWKAKDRIVLCETIDSLAA